MTGGGTARIGVLGGTFDPIHYVHLMMAREAARVVGLDRVLFLPAGRPSHREPSQVTSPGHRCTMVRIAITEECRFALSTVDVERPGETYTIDSLLDLRAEYGSRARLYFILGGDNLERLLLWQRSSELVWLAHFVGWWRQGYPLADPGLPPGRLTLLRAPHPAISASRIRERVRRGQPIAHLTPPAVAQYIHRQGLYRRDRAAIECADGHVWTEGPAG